MLPQSPLYIALFLIYYTEAARLAAEEKLRQASKTERDIEESKKAEEEALRDKRAAEDALEAAKAADDMAAIEEAQRLRKEAEERARASKMMKRLAQAIQRRDLNELEEVIKDVKKNKVTFIICVDWNL